jgi:hypothetical protein
MLKCKNVYSIIRFILHRNVNVDFQEFLNLILENSEKEYSMKSIGSQAPYRL